MNPYTHLLFDLPSEHEIDDRLVTECDVISSIIANKGSGRVKHIRATHLQTLSHRPRYEGIRYVHVAGHGTKCGPSFIGQTVTWQELAKRLQYYCKPLVKKEKRALCLSCCHSETGAKVLGKALRPLFTAIYYFSSERVYFDDKMVAWSLFYLLKTEEDPTKKLEMKDSEGELFRVNSKEVINTVIPDIGFRGPLRPSRC